MGHTTRLIVTMRLCSDAMFASGYSTPAGADSSNYTDQDGYPYWKGSSLKGALREAVENWLCWSDGDPATLSALFGDAGWNGLSDHRRIQCTPLTLQNPPNTPEECFTQRTFTAIENGIAKEGSLRVAECICSGLVFTGHLQCAVEDVPLLEKALGTMQWVGASRSRGFGRVAFSCATATAVANSSPIAPTHWFRYTVETKAPLVMTNPHKSHANGYETRNFILGSAIRGYVLSTLSQQNPQWFAQHKTALLTQVRFENALPTPQGQVALPTLSGFYEDKAQTALEWMVKTGAFTAGFKRASLGTCCALEGDTIRYWNSKTTGATRITRSTKGDTEPFQIRYLEENQHFEGYVYCPDDTLAPVIATLLQGEAYLGADRYEGFGRCGLTVEPIAQPKPMEKYGYSQPEQVGETLYLLACSPLSMVDAHGEPCGLDVRQLTQLLGVEQITLGIVSTSLTPYGGYNRQYGGFLPSHQMYETGSVFTLQCTPAPTLERIQALQTRGLGMRTSEGFGQVLFLRPECMDAITKKAPLSFGQERVDTQVALARQARCTWLMENGKIVNKWGLSKSQAGALQGVLETCKATNTLTAYQQYCQKNIQRIDGKHGKSFEKAQAFLDDLLQTPLADTVGAACPDGLPLRLVLAIDLLDYSRKCNKEVDG